MKNTMQKHAGHSLNKFKSLAIWFALIFILVVQYLFIGGILRFSEGISPLVFELFAAVMGSIVTVAAMAILMKAQARQDQEKEFSSHLFVKKIELYQQLLHGIFKIDDDNIVDREEIQDIENLVGVACLVANRELVSVFSQFMFQLKNYGVVYFRSMSKPQLDHFRGFIATEKRKSLEDSILANTKHSIDAPVTGSEVHYFLSLDEFIQGIRQDLAVVEGDVKHDIEHFVRTPINPYSLFKTPNTVE